MGVTLLTYATIISTPVNGDEQLCRECMNTRSKDPRGNKIFFKWDDISPLHPTQHHQQQQPPPSSEQVVYVWFHEQLLDGQLELYFNYNCKLRLCWTKDIIL